ncbi:uncharacterized protein LOC128966737 isoform X2 [Homo sapiens]|uniref:uncharacterized protein LOC128966737 isoform X2 n=1 Tax=Homo sapiens TaxID=9606 RepID=UPI0023DF2D13|nr:uncharacterized protein LOC128966737 isoform X2 [Homo sapiens]
MRFSAKLKRYTLKPMVVGTGVPGSLCTQHPFSQKMKLLGRILQARWMGSLRHRGMPCLAQGQTRWLRAERGPRPLTAELGSEPALHAAARVTLQITEITSIPAQIPPTPSISLTVRNKGLAMAHKTHSDHAGHPHLSSESDTLLPPVVWLCSLMEQKPTDPAGRHLYYNQGLPDLREPKESVEKREVPHLLSPTHKGCLVL